MIMQRTARKKNSLVPRLILVALLLSLLLGNKQSFVTAQDTTPSPGGGSNDAGKSSRTKRATAAIYDSALAGKIIPFMSKFSLRSSNAKNILPELNKQVNVEDFLVIAALGWLTVPAVRLPYNSFVKRAVKKDFEDTNLYQFATYLSEAARLALMVYVIDCLGIILKTMGFRISQNMSGTCAKIVYSTWLARRLQLFKRYLIIKGLSINAEKTGQAKVLNHILNGIIFGFLALYVLDILSVEMGFALTSVVAVGSTATLVISLASKDVAAKVVNGLALALSDKMYEGDYVEFGDGTRGNIIKMGWLETKILCSDELMVSIPNTQLANQRIYNVSRIRKSQVKQTLRFRYDDADKLPKVLEDIKAEVRMSCPKAITDGTRAFRAHWRDFKDDYLEVVVDFHFDIKPTGDIYWDNKQRVLMAIDRAVKKNDIDFYTSKGTVVAITAADPGQ